MEFKNRIRSGIIFSVLFALCVTIFPSDVIGQQQNQQREVKEQIKQLRERMQQRSSTSINPVSSGVDLGSIGSNFTVFNFDQSWNRNPNPDPQLNFPVFRQGQPAGNINGDSLNGNSMDDYVVTGLARNEQTSSLQDSTYKTAVFFGGNTSGTPDQIIYRRLVPVGDLNGDGYSDAMAAGLNGLNTQYSVPNEIYEGTDTGYQPTGQNIATITTENFNIIGFNDVDSDGRDDILIYRTDSADLTIARGLSNFGDMTFTPISGVLSTQTKRVAVSDVDQDSLTEVVQFSGTSGDGQIQVIQINTDLSTTVDQGFAYTSFGSTQTADQSYVHLIDITGDGNDEIFITFGQLNPDVFEYNNTSGSYETAPVDFFSGKLVPVGDLNNDGNYDFLQGGTSGTYISYGPDNLSTSLIQDVELNEITSGANWAWAANYNPYSSFGDLNGDGIDDAVISHTEISANDHVRGRRIISGASSGSPSSTFQTYPNENFFSSVGATEELDDINGDGINDFAMVFPNLQKVEIYYGGQNISQSPNQTINTPYIPQGITSGEFTGDGTSDFLLIGSGPQGSVLDVYSGGATVTNVKTIAASDFQTLNGGTVDQPMFMGISNIGDITGDGSDDFLVGSGRAGNTSGTTEYLNDAYIFHGGSTISSTPDQTIDFDPNGDYLQQNISAGGRAVSLGDLDNDGLGDFAVSAYNKQIGEAAGEVRVYLSGSSNPIVLNPDGSPFGFGQGLAAGDFNGDGTKDLAVSTIFTSFSPSNMIQVFHGSSSFDATSNQNLSLPDFNTTGDTLTSAFGPLESIGDYNNDGKDELLMGSSYVIPEHKNAALFTFGSTGSNSSVSVLEGRNPGAGLGGTYNFAAGDFNQDGQPDLVLTQEQDNNDAYRSSRVFRYNLSAPLSITGVEDVPNDQGDTVRVNIAGSYLQAASQSTFSYDSIKVQRQLQNGSWQTLKTTGSFAQSTASVVVAVPETQPSGDTSVDNSYTFRTEIYKAESLLARSENVTGEALDNIAPPKVQELTLNQQSGDRILSWQPTSANDLDKYLIINTSSSFAIFDSTTSTSFTLPGDLDGVHEFFVAARDVNNNIGAPSDPVEAIYPQAVSYNLQADWNLIGLPVNATASEIQTSLLDNADLVYEYDGGYKQVQGLQTGVGYWIKADNATVSSLENDPVTELSIDVEQGWNLISGVGGKLPTFRISDPDGVLASNPVYEFDQAYVESDTVRPGRGYWIRATDPGVIELTHPKLLPPLDKSNSKAQDRLAESNKNVEEKFNKAVVSDGEHTRELYFGAELPDPVKKTQFLLPPLPPGDFFDARFSNDTRLIEEKEAYIHLKRIEGTSISLEVIPQSLAKQGKFLIKEMAEGKLLTEYEVDAEKQITLKNSEATAIFLSPVKGSAISQNQKPEQFKLNQNYPNPFNPTTQIEYSIEEAATVKLEVYNILGRRVATIVNREQEPGNYEVTFNGSNLASGVYLYRLEAGSNVSTKKFILAK